ncbi:MAG: hypothetical protein ACOC2L_03445 [Candidatus Sumerlaeota bacterium]
MVDPYATKIGGFTAVINSERFVLEHTESNAIFSLHPAITLGGRTQATMFSAVEGFRTADNRLEVQWKAVEGVGAETVLEMESSGEGAHWFSLAVDFRNQSDATIDLAEGHPLYIPPEGPGTLALGHHELLGLAQGGENTRYYMIRVDGDELFSERLAVFFAPGGDPAVVIGGSDGESGPAVFLYSGARGKLLSFRVEGVVTGAMEPNAVLTVAPLKVGLGLADPTEGVERLSEEMQWPDLEDFPPHFDPAGEAEVLPVARETENIEEEAEAEAELSETPQETAVEAESDQAAAMPADEEDAGHDAGAVVRALPEQSRRRTAYYMQAQRMTRSFQETGQIAYQGWASGRRREPARPTSLRTRRQWRYTMPPAENDRSE